MCLIIWFIWKEFSSLSPSKQSETSSVCVRSCCRQYRVCLPFVWNSFHLFLREALRMWWANDPKWFWCGKLGTEKELIWRKKNYANCWRLSVAWELMMHKKFASSRRVWCVVWQDNEKKKKIEKKYRTKLRKFWSGKLFRTLISLNIF